MHFKVVEQQLAVCLLALRDESELGRDIAGNLESAKAELLLPHSLPVSPKSDVNRQ